MMKTIALTAMAVISVGAFAQSGMGNDAMGSQKSGKGNWNNSGQNWQQGEDYNWTYSTYNMSSVDINSLNAYQIGRLVRHSLHDANAADAYTIKHFLELLPPDQSSALLKSLAINFKQAAMVRDEVAMARFGSDQSYAWLSYPALTWSNTPGQNSWSAINFDSTPTPAPMASSGDGMIAMTDDQTRPMRMVMRLHGERDIDYDRAVDILGSGLSETERASIRETFHPARFDPNTYTNAEELDAVVRVIESSAKMADNMGRFAWYNHFDKQYMQNHPMGW